jgi:serine/threonine protein kinase
MAVMAQGYIKMADFGFAKKVRSDKTFTICGTPDYQAPEVIMRRGTSYAADYWALGVLVFEMLVGDPPFKSLTGDPWDTFRRTLSGRFYVPHFITDAAADLIYRLLQVGTAPACGTCWAPAGAHCGTLHSTSRMGARRRAEVASQGRVSWAAPGLARADLPRS